MWDVIRRIVSVTLAVLLYFCVAVDCHAELLRLDAFKPRTVLYGVEVYPVIEVMIDITTTKLEASIATPQDSVTGAVPQNPAKLINVFSFEKDKDGNLTNAQNNLCTQRFLISGAFSALNVSFSRADTNELSKFGTWFFSALKLVSGAVPLFLGGPLKDNILGLAKQAGEVQDPLKSLIGVLNGPAAKAVRNYRLRASKDPTMIVTDYSQVAITVRPINSLADEILKDAELKSSFYKVIDDLANPAVSGINADNLVQRCGQFADRFTKYAKFGSKDLSFILGYFAQAAFPGNQLNNRLACIGQEGVARDIVKYKFEYNQELGLLKPITTAAINDFTFPGAIVAISESVSGPYLEKLMGLLGGYSKNDDPGEKAKFKGLVNPWMGAVPSDVQDLTSRFWPTDATASASDFVDKLTPAYRRFGCFFFKSADQYDAIFLGLPLEPASGATYDPTELIGFRVKLAGTGTGMHPRLRVLRLQVTGQSGAIVEAATKNSGICGEAKKVKLQ